MWFMWSRSGPALVRDWLTCSPAGCLQVEAQRLGLSTLDAFSVSVKVAQAPLHAISAYIRLGELGANWTASMPLLKLMIADQMMNVPDYVIQVDPAFIGGLKMPPGVADVNAGVNL